jgi:ABC-type multidrug transport system ATPase subunit
MSTNGAPESPGKPGGDDEDKASAEAPAAKASPEPVAKASPEPVAKVSPEPPADEPAAKASPEPAAKASPEPAAIEAPAAEAPAAKAITKASVAKTIPEVPLAKAAADKLAAPAQAPAPDSEPAASLSSEDGAVKSKGKKKKSSRSGKPAAIDLKGLSKHFGSVKAVDDVTFEVPEGSVFGLIGPNGAGKTTTFSMLAGYLAPTSGEVYVLDHWPDAVDFLKGKLGILPQDALLPANEKVGDFLMFLARLQGIDAGRARKAVGSVLEEVEGTAWWNIKCGALSHGMAKRIGLAQALLGDPEVVLLDEPTAGLDPRVAYGVRQIVKSRKGRCTLVISSHNLQELEEICDHAAIMDHGHLVVAGTMNELTASSEEIRVELGRGPIPEDLVRGIEGVKLVAFDRSSRELVVNFDRRVADAEEMIRRVLWVLLQNNARISGVSKGRGLEQRVMELTE